MRNNFRALAVLGLSLCFALQTQIAIQAQTDLNDSDEFFQRTSRTATEQNHTQKIEDLLKRMTLEEKVGQMTQLAIGMMLLGLGWSGTMVAGSTMLSESVPLELRASAQGLSDLVMGLAGALAGAISGLIVEGWGYPRLTLLAAIATAPLLLILWSSVKVPDEVKISA